MHETPSVDTDGRVEAGSDIGTADRKENVFGTIGRATEFFTPEHYRPYQRETIEAIESAYEQGYRHVVIDAPTGTGKSHIARALAFQANDAHILTVQKLLQDQYLNEFSDMYVMKGRSAYLCARSDSGDTCANGPCRLKKRAVCEDCPYRLAKWAAMNAAVTVHNFDSFYYQNMFGMGFTGRKLLIVDEAHNIAGKFSEFLSFTIDSRGGIVVPEGETLEDYDEFVKSAYTEYSKELEGLRTEHELVGLDMSRVKRMDDLGMSTSRMRGYLTERQKPRPPEYVFDYSESGRYGPSVTFRPVFAGAYASQWLFKYGERTLMMSATILDKEMFCREVGLDPSEVAYIAVPSSFPAENRPIVKKYAGKMSYRYIDGTLPKIAEYVQEIADRFPDRRGIVQTHSDKIARYLQEHLDDPRFTYNSDFPTPQAMLVAHKMKRGSFIVASGLREGLDLRGDMSKIQIFCKIPYPSLGDKVVARKMELDDRWYGWMTTVMFVQSLGRSVRSSNERAVTYILDSGFGFFYTKNKAFIPDYIKEAISW